MRVLILANFDLGLYQFRKELIYELLKENEVYISLPYGNLVDPLVEAGCTFVDTPIDRRGINPAKDISLLIKYDRIIKRIRPEIVITYTVKPNIYGGIVCRRRKIPYAVNITGLGTAFERQGFLRKLVTAMYKVGLKGAKTVFFENSTNQALFINERIIRRDKACLLNGAGVNLDHFAYLEYPRNSAIRFLFIGRVMQEKGIDELLKAVQRLNDEGSACMLDIVGPYEDNYEQQINSYASYPWFTYHGYQKDVRPYIEDADCFVLPSWHEGMANTNLECAASGRPVITSNIPGCKEAVIEGVTGLLCEPKNTDSLYAAMKKMMQMTWEARREMGMAGRKHMESDFDKKIIVKQTMDNLGLPMM